MVSPRFTFDGRSSQQGLFTILAVSLLGCNPTTTGPLDVTGEYAAMISGDVTADLTGEATFSTLAHRQWGRRWGVMMATGRINEETSDLIVLTRRGSRRAPAPGTYQIGDERTPPADGTDFVATLAHSRHPARLTTFRSLQGSLTITEATDDVVAGTFVFDAVIFFADGEPLGREITVAGEFRASRSLFVLVSASPAMPSGQAWLTLG